MAYKFQLGAAVLSGSIKADDGLISTNVDDATAANIVAQIDAGEIAIAKLAESTISGKALGTNLDNLTDGNGIADFTFNGSGAATIAIDLASNKGLEFDGGAALGVKVKANSGIVMNSDGIAVDADPDSFSLGAGGIQLAANVAGNGLGLSSGVLSVGVDGSSVELSSDALRVKALGVTNAMLAGSIANAKLANSTISGKALGANLDALAVDDSSIEYSAGSAFNGSAASTIRVKALGVTNAMLAGSIANAKLANDGITIAGADTSLGGSITSAAILNTDMGGAFTIGSQADDLATFKGPVTIEGNLTVLGSSVEIDAGFVVTSSVKFEGTTPDGNETELIATNPTADRTITLPDLSGHVPLIAGAATAASIAVTAAEFALLDGATSRGVDALADGDGFMHNDNGSMKQTNVLKMFEYTVAKVSGDVVIADTGAATIQAAAVEGSMLNDNAISGQAAALTSGLADTDEFLISDGGLIKRMDASVLKSYVSDAAADVQNVAAAGTLVVGINYFSDMSSDGEDAVALPASPSVGQSVKVKAPSDCSEARYITINRAGSQTIDGAVSIRLESPFAAVELVYVANDLWRVF
jgi:hypothetical protein